MKAARILAVAILAVAPALSFADTGHGLTRAEVRADLVRLEKAGYNPAGSEAHYPDDIAAAEHAVAAAEQVARSTRTARRSRKATTWPMRRRRPAIATQRSRVPHAPPPTTCTRIRDSAPRLPHAGAAFTAVLHLNNTTSKGA